MADCFRGKAWKIFFSSSMLENRKLMRVFKDVGLGEKLGSGMSRILAYRIKMENLMKNGKSNEK